MAIQSKEMICEKCGSVMDRIEKQPPRSFGMFSGVTDTSSTSIASTIATTITIAPSTPPPEDEFFERPEPIKIVKYVCSDPKCGWECQKRE
jgi:hypothetical protein